MPAACCRTRRCTRRCGHRVRAARRCFLAVGSSDAAGRHHRGDGAGQQLHAARACPQGLCHRRRLGVAAAINSLLTAIGDTPARVFLEAGRDDDKHLPVTRTADVVWVDCKNSGEALVQAVSASAFDAADHFGWVACDNRTTREVAKSFREDYKIPRKSIKAQAYWVT